MRPAPGRLARALLLTALLLASTACAHSSGPKAPRRTPNLMTYEELTSRPFGSVYDAIEALRANWLHTRGATSINTPTQIWVYLDGTRLGGLGSLRTLQPSAAVSVERIDALTATTRWGIGHGQGVILVTSSVR
jgi:hypothetical protein